jgi:hypothetical protein
MSLTRTEQSPVTIGGWQTISVAVGNLEAGNVMVASSGHRGTIATLDISGYGEAEPLPMVGAHVYRWVNGLLCSRYGFRDVWVRSLAPWQRSSFLDATAARAESEAASADFKMGG